MGSEGFSAHEKPNKNKEENSLNFAELPIVDSFNSLSLISQSGHISLSFYLQY